MNSKDERNASTGCPNKFCKMSKMSQNQIMMAKVCLQTVPIILRFDDFFKQIQILFLLGLRFSLNLLGHPVQEVN